MGLDTTWLVCHTCPSKPSGRDEFHGEEGPDRTRTGARGIGRDRAGGVGAGLRESPTVTTDSGVLPGEQFRIFGSGCISGTVDVTFNGQTFPGVPVDSQGNWFLDVTAPAHPGTYTVQSNCGGTVATTTVEVLPAAARPGAAPNR